MQGVVGIDGCLRNQVGDGLRRDTELTRELGRRATDARQLDDLLAELRRIWGPGSRHRGLLPSKGSCFHESGSTPNCLHTYNHERPHQALGRIPPVAFRQQNYPNLYF